MTLGGLKGLRDWSPGVAVSVGNNGQDTTYSGVLKGTYTSLTKTGAGTLTLSGANSYSGNTIVNAGMLLVNGPGSLAASSAVSVGAGATAATLGGDGTIYGTVTVGAKGHTGPRHIHRHAQAWR